jgi:serine/threonine protein kinase
VGVLLYAMLTGKLPIEASTPMELVRKQLTEPPLPPSARRPGGVMSEDLERLVMRALSPDPASRPASAVEMRSELLACALLADPDLAGEAQSTAKAGDAGDAGQTIALPRPPGRRTPSPTPAPGQGPRARTPFDPAKRPASPPLEQRPETPSAPSSAASIHQAGSAREVNGPVAKPVGRTPTRPTHLGLMARIGAGVGVLALAIGLYVWKGRGRDIDSIAKPLPAFKSAPGPTPAPSAAPTPLPSSPPSPEKPPPANPSEIEPTPSPQPTASPASARPAPDILPQATPKPTFAAPRPKARLVLTSKMSGRVLAAVGPQRLELNLNVPRRLEIPVGTVRVSFALLGATGGTCAVALDISEGQQVGLVFGPESGFVTRLGSGAQVRTKIECR